MFPAGSLKTPVATAFEAGKARRGTPIAQLAPLRHGDDRHALASSSHKTPLKPSLQAQRNNVSAILCLHRHFVAVLQTPVLFSEPNLSSCPSNMHPGGWVALVAFECDTLVSDKFQARAACSHSALDWMLEPPIDCEHVPLFRSSCASLESIHVPPGAQGDDWHSSVSYCPTSPEYPAALAHLS